MGVSSWTGFGASNHPERIVAIIVSGTGFNPRLTAGRVRWRRERFNQVLFKENRGGEWRKYMGIRGSGGKGREKEGRGKFL